MIKWIILAIFIISALYIQRRGKVKHSFYRQFFDHSTLLAPINFLMYIFSKVPNQPYIDTQHFKDLKVLDEHWEMIRDEAKALYEQLVEYARQQFANVQTGIFAADMKVHLINDGPVTFNLEIE